MTWILPRQIFPCWRQWVLYIICRLSFCPGDSSKTSQDIVQGSDWLILFPLWCVWDMQTRWGIQCPEALETPIRNGRWTENSDRTQWTLASHGNKKLSLEKGEPFPRQYGWHGKCAILVKRSTTTTIVVCPWQWGAPWWSPWTQWSMTEMGQAGIVEDQAVSSKDLDMGTELIVMIV